MKRIIINILYLFFILMGIKGSAQHQDLYEAKVFINNLDTLNYRILYPKNFSEDKLYPLVLFLHGAGERGDNNRSQLTHGSKLFASDENRDAFPAIVIFPQCPQNDYWANVSIDRTTQPLSIKFQNGGEPTKAMSLVLKLMEDMIAKPYVAKQQVYVGGLSMGGMGTFEILSRKPSMFAAAIAICGGGSKEAAKAYAKTTELWIFHGAKDDVVIPQLSIDMVSAILEYGGTPNFTLYADANHNSWDATFAEPKLLPWLFSKTKNTNENTN
jgi:predicted peptidase